MAKKKVEDKNNQNDDNTKNEGDVSSNEEEPNFSDPEGYVDDVSDEGINLYFVPKNCITTFQVTYFSDFSNYFSNYILYLYLLYFHLIN